MNKLEELLLLYASHLCIITETWLNKSIRDDEIVPSAYQLYRRVTGSHSGGLAVIAKKGIKVDVLNQIHTHESLLLRVVMLGVQFFLSQFIDVLIQMMTK